MSCPRTGPRGRTWHERAAWDEEKNRRLLQLFQRRSGGRWC